MNNQLESIYSFLDKHSVSVFFNCRVLEAAQGKLVVSLRLRDDYQSSGVPEGVAGSLVDAVARSAGLDVIGRSYISEYEINFRPQLSSGELIATAVVDSRNHLYMTYACEIHQFEDATKRLVIESQGTLNKARPQDVWTSRKVIHELGVC